MHFEPESERRLLNQKERRELTGNQYDGFEEGEAKELLSVVDEGVVGVTLRVQLSAKRHAGDHVHGEAAGTPGARTHTHTHTHTRTRTHKH